MAQKFYTVICIINGHGVFVKSYIRHSAACKFALAQHESGQYDSVIIRVFDVEPPDIG